MSDRRGHQGAVAGDHFGLHCRIQGFRRGEPGQLKRIALSRGIAVDRHDVSQRDGVLPRIVVAGLPLHREGGEILVHGEWLGRGGDARERHGAEVALDVPSNRGSDALVEENAARHHSAQQGAVARRAQEESYTLQAAVHVETNGNHVDVHRWHLAAYESQVFGGEPGAHVIGSHFAHTVIPNMLGAHGVRRARGARHAALAWANAVVGLQWEDGPNHGRVGYRRRLRTPRTDLERERRHHLVGRDPAGPAFGGGVGDGSAGRRDCADRGGLAQRGRGPVRRGGGERNIQVAILESEQQRLLHSPEEEFEELVEIYQAKGLSPELSRAVATELHARDALAAQLDAEFDMEHPAEKIWPFRFAMKAGLAFLAGSLGPLLLFLIMPFAIRGEVTLVVVAISLTISGWIGARSEHGNPWISIARTVAIGLVTLGISSLAGSLVTF